jgi:hypothetical protein
MEISPAFLTIVGLEAMSDHPANGSSQYKARSSDEEIAAKRAERQSPSAESLLRVETAVQKATPAAAPMTPPRMLRIQAPESPERQRCGRIHRGTG